MSPSWVSPGVAYLTRGLLSVVVPAASSVIIVARLASLKGVRVSPWIISAVVLGATPLGFAAYILADGRSQKRKAKRLGARLVPRVQGKWPGNLDKVVNMVLKSENEYLGRPIEDEIKLLGPTVNFRFFWEDSILTTEPQHIKTMLATDFDNYAKGAKFREAADSVLGTGVFNSDGETWKLHRTMTRPFFTHDRIGHFEIFDRHADHAIALAKERFRAGLAIDFQDLISRFTLDSASEFLFGHCIDSLSARLPYPNDATESANVIQGDNPSAAFSDAFSQAQQIINRRISVGHIWPLFEILADSTAQHMKVVNAFLDPILKDALEKHSTAVDLDRNDNDQTLVDHLVNLTSGETARYYGISVVEMFFSDFKIIKDETLNILLAGRDTTASTLTSAIYLLTMHPAFLARLREEIISKVGPTGRPTYDNIKEMKYLRAVLNGAYSRFLLEPQAFRENMHDTTWTSPEPGKKPLFIPQGTMLSYSVFLMHRRTDLWGPDALEFDPDRWLDERVKKYLIPNPYIFLPFNAGPRICLGQQFAYNEMSFMLIRLLQNFSAITLAPEPAMRPPAWWAERDGRQAIERFRPRNHLTLFSKASSTLI
ncbi:cytochrome P450 [Suillus clintonianus]|uniref:cytochrome P450 n=1 Tax=Suillus clintonianus TaxID=1904413 RepID=UPI001B85E0C6|nr:cytochrome P450 [Suillus clintonianus]KAG2143714.1 cytochrome P450 [Suillus clintonianus]